MAKAKIQVKTPEKKVKKMTKFDMVKALLINYKTITSWEAITLFKHTRLSDSIYRLKKDYGWEIDTIMFESKEEQGVNYGKYFLRSLPNK